MHFIKVASILSGLLATSDAVSIRFHALNHYKKFHIDLVCPHIHINVCCKPPNVRARSLTFLHGKGDNSWACYMHLRRTRVDTFPSDLTKFMVPTDDWSNDIAYVASADESE
ncbi:hypothetical protein F5B21DRAFT_503229 [Xylaria acuta]|nr:hypothetical protein F5B21DRAFT_503229 [Xylaria acuta]